MLFFQLKYRHDNTLWWWSWMRGIFKCQLKGEKYSKKIFTKITKILNYSHVCVDISVRIFCNFNGHGTVTMRECKILVSCHDKLILGKRLSVDFMTEIIPLMFAVLCESRSLFVFVKCSTRLLTHNRRVKSEEIKNDF